MRKHPLRAHAHAVRPAVAIVLFLLCAWAGNRKRAGLEARLHAIGAMAVDIRKLHDIMELTPMPIAEATLRLHCALWKEFAKEVQTRQCSARQAFEKALEGAPEYGGDRDALEGFFDVLRASEMRAQLNALSLLARDLDERRAHLAAELEKKGKIYSSLGVLMGLSLALLVI